MSNKPQKAIAITKTHIAALKPVAIAHDPAVKQQFVAKFSQMYQVPQSEAIRFYDREADNFSRLVSGNDSLRECTPMSLYMAFMRVGGWRLSFDNSKEMQVYMVPGNRTLEVEGRKVKIKEVVAQPSPYGEKEMRLNNGILKKVGNPVVVHKGDFYSEKLDASGNKVVEWEGKGQSNQITGSFIRLVEPDGTIVFVTFSLNDISRWKASSEKKNSYFDQAQNRKVLGKANALYTSGPDNQIDEGFLKGKTLTHAFKGYPRMDLGNVPEGFKPEEKAIGAISGFASEDMFDDYEEETEETANQPAQTDDFTKAVQEDEPEKESVKPNLNDDDDMFN